MDTQVAAHFATIVAAITGIIVLGFTAFQLRLNAQARAEEAKVRREEAKVRTEEANARKANFWLELRKMFADHHEVHTKLTPDGAWWDSHGTISEEDGDGVETYTVTWARENHGMSVEEWERLPGPTGEEWRHVEAYMGLLEHCEPMLRQELIDLQTFKDIYGYRLRNIMRNRKIVMEKLGERRKGWQRFIKLLRLVGIKVPPQKNLLFRQ